MTKNTMKKMTRIGAMFLAVVMVFCLFPVMAFAEAPAAPAAAASEEAAAANSIFAVVAVSCS